MAEAAVSNVSLSRGSEAVFDIECAPCSAEGQHKEAVRYCRDCGTYLCGDCVRFHTKLPSLKHHRLVDIDAITTKQDTPYVLDACTERCPDHQSEIITFFCPDHNITACSVCVTLDHTLCEHMQYIEDAAAGIENRQDYKEFETPEDTVTLALENKQKSTDCHTTAMQDLDAYREELVGAVDRHVEAIRDQAGKMHAQDTDKMDKLASHSNKVLTELRAVATSVNNFKSRKHFCKLFVEMKQKEQSFRELQENLEEMRDHKVTAYFFQPDETLREMIGSQDSLGKLVLTKTESSKSFYRSKSDQASNKQERGLSKGRDKAGKASSLQVVPVPVRNAKKIDELNLKSTNNTQTCSISGMTVVSEDRVVFADWVNGNIKLIGTSKNKILSEHKPRSVPYDVATCKETVAATLTWSSEIVFLKHTNRLVHDKDIPVNGKCRGIDWYDDKLYVIFDDPKKLDVMTITGVVLQTFSTTTGGHQLFDTPWHVTVSSTNRRIYVSECYKSRMVTLDLDGNQTGTYENGELGRPRQLAVDGSGVMYLCDRSTNTVHLLSPAGKKVKILLTSNDGIVNPSAVCYCGKTGRLYVGMHDCDKITVYQISS